MRFFFSYSRKNNDTFLRDFFQDLNKEVQERSSNGSLEEGFFDQDDLELGEFWEPKLESALRQSRVFVAAVTPGCLESEYCAKEWRAFEARVSEYANTHNTQAPPVILPLIWVPSPEPLPQFIAARQYTQGNPDDVWNKKGLKHICKLKSQLVAEHTVYLEALADRIVKLGQQYGALDAVASVRHPSDLPPGFPGTPQVQAASSPGPKRVHFVFTAAPNTEIQNTGKQNTAGYGDLGGEKWQPYLPAPVEIGTIARQTATADALALWPDEISVSPNLPQLIRDKEGRRELVVVFVDGWTAALPQYRDTLQRFDRENYVNCSVLVPWNDHDDETSANNAMLLSALANALQFRVANKNPLYYRAPICTEAELRTQLADVLTRLRAEVINKSTPPPGSVPPGGTRPIISGPGGS